MTKQYTDAHDYIDTFYRRKRNQLNAMKHEANIAADNFYRIMQEPAVKSLQEVIFGEVFKFALAAVPGAGFISKTWLRLSAARPIFAAQTQYFATTVVAAGQSTHAVVNQAGAANKTLSETLSDMLIKKMNQIYQRINIGLTSMEKEQTEAEESLRNKVPGPNYLQAIKGMLGPCDPELLPSQVEAIRTNFEIELFKAYAKSNSEIIEVYWGRTNMTNLYETKFKGFNNVQEEYLRQLLGIKTQQDWVNKLGVKVRKVEGPQLM